MKIIHDLQDLQEGTLEHNCVLTIGAFDGLHLGHQELLRRLVRRAQQTQRQSAVLTFNPHPRAVLSTTNHVVCLISMEEKTALLERLGVDMLVILPFTEELARTSAHDFMQLLVEHLNLTELWVGWDFALGRGREGDVPMLKKLGQELGYVVHVVEPVQEGQVTISSTQIRQLISAGRVAEAAEMLGRYHQLKGRVPRRAGVGRGRQLGFATANLEMYSHCALPPSGVYAVYATVGNQRHPAAVNIGFQSVSGGQECRVEVYLLDFDEDLPGQEILVQFVERVRDERRFTSVEASQSQIAKDLERVREILT
jgi:riboflavin kinase/FMN adenylyltransferase